jgi:antitoxin VapB
VARECRPRSVPRGCRAKLAASLGRATAGCLGAVARRRCLTENTHNGVHTWGDVETLTTRVFNNGNSQAVRIPAEFRLDTDRVSISRNESGDLVIHPLRAERGAGLLDALRAVGEADIAFIAALEAEQRGPQPMQEREAL